MSRPEDEDDGRLSWAPDAAGASTVAERVRRRLGTQPAPGPPRSDRPRDWAAHLSALYDVARSLPSERLPSSRASPLPRGLQVDHYQVVRPLGQGAMGDVFLARDTVLARPVALKLLRGLEGDSQAFLREARATAALNHPNIVVIFGAGTHDGQPYLALEYIEGSSLAERASPSPLPIAEVLRHGRSIAHALDAAHSTGLVHCDLKPQNVLIGRDGRARVVDFGLAAWTDQEGGTGGTPAYMAPEQWWGRAPTPAVDIWAWGVLIYEQLTGRLPFDAASMQSCLLDRTRPPLDLSLSDLPAEVAELVRACLEPDATQRPDAGKLCEALDAGKPGASRNRLAKDVCPFRGLESFETSHASLFFGRDTEVTALQEHLRNQAIVSLVGVSGVGKSSLVRAGLLPALRSEARWQLLDLRPGHEPFEALAVAFRTVSRSTPGGFDAPTAETLRQRPEALSQALVDLGQRTRSHVLLLVDQLEELFSLTPDRPTRERFLEAISRAADASTPDTRVVLTIRDDYLGRLAESPDAPRLLERLFLVRAPDSAALRQAITEPLRLVRHRLDPPELADEMVGEIAEHPARLPLLQFACRALWSERDPSARTLSAEAYRRINGAKGALTQHADRVLSELPPTNQRIARSLLLALVTPTGDRAPREAEDLAPDEDHRRVLEQLVRHRLVLTRRNGGSESSSYELVHDCLVDEWPQLRKWLDDTREERALLDEIQEAADLWHREGEPPDAVWTGPRLLAREARMSELGVAPRHPTAQRFLHASRNQHRSRERRRRLALGGTVALSSTIALIATFAALTFRDQAEALDRAAANLGRFNLTLRTYDLGADDHSITSVPPPRNLRWRLLEPSAEDPDTPGYPVDPRYLRIRTLTSTDAHAARYAAEARGGAAFLEVSQRGRGCAPSVLRLRRLPGHADRARNETMDLEVWIPTCRASLDTTIGVPGGPFVFQGPGDPASSHPEYVDPERIVDLPAFRIDRTEVSNRAFRAFTRMARHHGVRMPSYPKAERFAPTMAAPTHPAVLLTARAAQEYCRYMGKRLPSSLEWEKAARGGLALAPGAPNPRPRRLVPWGTDELSGPANIKGGADGHIGTASVFAFTEGASPYGVLNLSGNAAEWTTTTPEDERGTSFRTVRGGDWQSPPELHHWTMAYENKRAEQDADLTVGFRCVTEAATPP